MGKMLAEKRAVVTELKGHGEKDCLAAEELMGTVLKPEQELSAGENAVPSGSNAPSFMQLSPRRDSEGPSAIPLCVVNLLTDPNLPLEVRKRRLAANQRQEREQSEDLVAAKVDKDSTNGQEEFEECLAAQKSALPVRKRLASLKKRWASREA